MSELKQLVPSELKPPLNRTLVTDERGLAKVESFLGRTVEFCYDLETNVVPTFVQRKIRTMQIGNREEQYVIDLLAFAGATERLNQQGWRQSPDWAQPIVDVVRPALDSNTHLKVGANLEFEYVTSCWCLGLKIWHVWDCYLAEKVLNAGKVSFFQPDYWGLDDMIARYTGLKISKALQKSFDLETPLTEDQIDYGALDVRLPLPVKIGQIRTAEKIKVMRAIQIENYAIPAFAEMHLNGFRLDPERWKELVSATEIRHRDNIKVLDTHFLPVVGTKENARPYSELQLSCLEDDWRNEPGSAPRKKVAKPCVECEHPLATEDDDEDTDPTVPPFEEAELAGAVATEAPVNKRKVYRKAFEAARRELKAWEKLCSECEGEAFINYGGNDQVLQALRTMGFNEKKLPNTNDKSLSKVSDHPAIKALQDYRGTAKLLSTYGLNWLEYINPETGLIHARHIQLGAETGRPSCTKPNLYNIPKEKEYRACFTAEDGFVLITLDESGAELRIIAELSKDQSWIDAFAHNWDMHSVGAVGMKPAEWAAATGPDCEFAKSKQKCDKKVCPVHDKMRGVSKNLNFKVAYGGTAYTLADDLRIPRPEAEEFLRQHRKANSGVHKYLDGSGLSAKMNLCSRTLSNRIRFFVKPTFDLARERAEEDAKKFKRTFRPETDVKRKYGQMYGSIEREGKNSPIQGLNADITKLAMGSDSDADGKPYMWHLLKDYNVTNDDGSVKEAKLVNHVYDEFVVKCPVETAKECMVMMGDCVKRAAAEFMKAVVMDWEGKIANCWSK